jgi:hypothetical protein
MLVIDLYTVHCTNVNKSDFDFSWSTDEVLSPVNPSLSTTSATSDRSPSSAISGVINTGWFAAPRLPWWPSVKSWLMLTELLAPPQGARKTSSKGGGRSLAMEWRRSEVKQVWVYKRKMPSIRVPFSIGHVSTYRSADNERVPSLIIVQSLRDHIELLSLASITFRK